MHLAMIGPYPLPGRPCRGGVERVIHVLRKELAKRLRVTLIVPGVSRGLHYQDEYGDILYIKRSPIPGFLSYWTLTSRSVYQAVKRINPDIVHVQAEAGCIYSWPDQYLTSGPPRVFTPHGVGEADILYLRYSNALYRLTAPARSSIVKMIERRSRSRYNTIIAINPYVLEAMRDVAELQHHFIENPVDSLFLTAPAASREEHNGYRIVQIGVINSLKNVLGSIHIVHELVRKGLNITLNVVGPVVDTAYYNRCREEISRLGLESAVIFHGDASPLEVAKWMDTSDALLLVSRQENSPMVIAEAHCRGLPVAVPRAFGLRWMVDEGLNGIFLDGSTPSENASRLAKLLERPLDRRAIRRNATARYELGAVIDRTIGVYNETLATRSSASIEESVTTDS